MKYTDEQLKQVFPKLLPGKITWTESIKWLEWLDNSKPDMLGEILDSELLQLCWEVEETLTDHEWVLYTGVLCDLWRESKCGYQFSRFITHATWQQRIQALAAVKGITI